MRIAIVVFLVVAGCAGRRDVVAIAAAGKLWAGTTVYSPSGIVPYGVAVTRNGETIVIETPAEIESEKLPPGAYQKFMIRGKPGARVMRYRTAAAAGTFEEGELREKAAEAKGAAAFVARDGKMEVVLAPLEGGELSFRVFLHGSLHLDVVLASIATAE